MSVSDAKKISKDGQVIKGVFLLYNNPNSDTVHIEELPAGTQKSIAFKLRFKVQNKTAERKITIYSKTYKGALKEALSRREDFINKLRDGKLEQTRIKQITLNDAMDEYLSYKGTAIKPRTKEYYEQTYDKWIKPKLGKRILKDITVKDLQSIVNMMLKQDKAPRTTQSIKQIMRPLFKYYADKGIINGNPAALIQIPKFDNTVQVTLSKNDIAALFRAIKCYPTEPFHTLFMWLSEGRRLNELLSIEWKQINFSKKTYLITSSKNKAGVAMEYRLRDNIIERLKGFDQESPFVFHALTDSSKQMSKETVRGHWAKLLKNANIEHLRIHDLRHIIGSDLVSNNFTLEEVAQVLGHTSTSVTKRYSKVRQEKANEALDSFFDRING
ncbi:site-specific integrase [Sulfurovum sp.]|uniref:tyrosine-type recombinase/integrase n=1 Tax=Sulfurovum sp. TaxID=1969726 RepID=UPI0025D52294|nr:site-specific integrase [Sulfurovum sp.]